ncbi:hypothetical protein JCM5296_007323 [Sporobolomyces johnsonii]
MSVTLQPSGVLGFQRPLTRIVRRTLAIYNPGGQPLQYKVKTTAPKNYCVRPNAGRIEPGETVEVQVLLQPMKEDPPPGAKCRDKFLVQSVIITPEREGVAQTDLWQIVEKEEKEKPGQIFEQKIRCTYLPAADGEPSSIPEETPSKVNDPSAADASFVSTLSPAPRRTSPSTPSSPPNLAPAASGSPAASSPVVAAAPDASSAPATAPSSALASKASSALEKPEARAPTPTPPSAAPTPSPSSDELARLRTDLAAAQSEITRLRAQLAQAETTAATLRSRGGAGAASGAPAASSGPSATGPGTAQAVVGMQGQEGVPVQIVAGIAFGVFVVTWLFF